MPDKFGWPWDIESAMGLQDGVGGCADWAVGSRNVRAKDGVGLGIEEMAGRIGSVFCGEPDGGRGERTEEDRSRVARGAC